MTTHDMAAGDYTGEELSVEQAESMLALYQGMLDDLGYDAIPYPDLDGKVHGSVLTGAKFNALNQARWMCDETERFIREHRFAKAYRWIGFIQGLLFMGGVCSIAELKEHNRRQV